MTTEPTAVLSIRVDHATRAAINRLVERYDSNFSEVSAWLIGLGLARLGLAIDAPPPRAGPPKRSRSPQDPEVRRARASKGGTAGGRGRGKKRDKGDENG